MSLSFEEKLNIFDEYLSEYKDYPAVKEEYKNFKIGNWINTIRMIYNHGQIQENNDIVYKSSRLTKEQILLLKAHNFYYSDFDMYLSYLKEFIAKNNRYPLFNETYNGKNIGSWVVKNRVIYNNGIIDENNNRLYKTFKLTPKQIDKLNEMGFIWVRNVISNTWDINFNLLKEFINEVKRFPKNSEVYKGKNIGAWCNSQRLNINKGEEVRKGVYQYSHNSPTTKEQANKLIDLGFEFIIRKDNYNNKEYYSKEDQLLQQRYLLLQLDSVLKNQKNIINSKSDVEEINKLYYKKIFK